MTIYSEYSKARFGWFFGFSGWQIGAVALGVFLPASAISREAWGALFPMTVLWILLSALILVPVKGRSAPAWVAATAAFALGGAAGRTRFRSRAARGLPTELDKPDIPGVLGSLEMHEGPPTGPAQTRIAIIQNHATKTWACTAAVRHPGIGLEEPPERDRLGAGLAELINSCSLTEMIDEVLFTVRSVPDDGAERRSFMETHRAAGGPELSRRINDDLHENLSRASVRTEQFVTIVVPEARLGRAAREDGGGLEARARMLYLLMGEVEAQLRGAVGMSDVTWLTSPELSAACRTGFAPGDRAGIIDAVRRAATDSSVAADVPWALAGPSGTDPFIRHYSHDAWNSISSTLKLPERGALMGALAPVLTPTEPGERRSFVVAFPIISRSAGSTKVRRTSQFSAMGDELSKAAKKDKTTEQEDARDTIKNQEKKVARGHALTEPYAVVTVTVPKTLRITEYGRRLDASIRNAGFSPLRLDLAQDVAFAATSVPLGVSLTRGTSL